MLAIVLAVLAAAPAPQVSTFEITNNKPFVQVTVDGSAPLWFVLDTGNNGNSILARECADRLKLQRGAEQSADVGAGSGAEVRLSEGAQPMLLRTLGDTITVARPTLMTLGHVGKTEGRRVDGLIGNDFLSRHVVELDYVARRITLHDPSGYAPPAGAVVVPLELDTGWPIVAGSITMADGTKVPCNLIVDTGVRGVVTMFRPFSEKHGLHEAAKLHDLVIGGGAGGVSRGDVGRLSVLTLGPRSFENAVAIFSRDTKGIFALDGPDGIIGGEILRRHRVTFDYPHARMILEPLPEQHPFEYDMSGVFLAADDPDYAKIRVMAVNPKTPAEEAGLEIDDEVISIDGKKTPKLTLSDARNLLRVPGSRKLEIRRDGKVMRLRLEARRMV